MQPLEEGEKFALVTLPLTHTDGLVDGEVAPGVWLTTKMPIPQPSDAHSWIGTADFDFLADHDYFLFTKLRSTKPDVLDGENTDLVNRLRWILWALVVDSVTMFEDAPVALTGARVGAPLNRVEVRRREPLPLYYFGNCRASGNRPLFRH